MVNENCVASIITALLQTDSDARCKRAFTVMVMESLFVNRSLCVGLDSS